MTAVREERRLVTCMFADVVGSTELTMRLGAERLKRELGAAFTQISGIISAHGGTVEKYVGDAIYALFGAPVAHEDDPLRALRAAVALREWCAAGAAHGHPFVIRVGIETGEAVVDLEAAATSHQQMSVGPVVNIAARLQQRAEPGEILIGPTLREATEASAELEPLGELELKGIGRLPAWRLVRTGVSRARALPFVGREAELGLLDHAFQRASKGRSVLAVVSGPPGQGKSRLVQEFLLQRAERCHVIATRCRPPDEVGVFAPIREILGVTTLDALAEQIGRLCTDDVECERVVAGLADSAGIAQSRSLSSLPAAEREDEVIQAWRRYVGLLGHERLVVLAVDDIHWADVSLVRLVDRITFGGPRVLVVATARPEFAEAAGIRPTGDRFFVELEGLEPEEAKRLAGLAGRDDERVVQRAEGNPLFLVELARAGGGELPLTLQGALGARLDQLAAPDRALLSFAGVAGERFTAADAAFLTQRETTDAGRALARLADLHFLDQTDGGYRFHHGLVRDVAYGRLLTAERMKAHARFARERTQPEDAETLAYHWWEALRPPDAEWVWETGPDLSAMRREAFRALLVSGQRNAAHLAVDRGTELLERALTFAEHDAERAEAEQALGVAYRQILRQDESWEHLVRALDLSRSEGVPLDLYADLIHSALYSGAFRVRPPHEEVERIAAEGEKVARAVGDMRTLSQILRSHGMYLMNVGIRDTDRAAALIEGAVAAADASGDADARRRALLTWSGLLRSQGRLEESGALLDGLSVEGADALERLMYVRARTGQALLSGELEAAERSAEESIALADAMGPHNRTHAWDDLVDVLVARGDWDHVLELAHRIARVVAEEKASAFCRSAASAMRAGAIAHALRGEREEALALIRDMPKSDIEVDLVAAVPRALLGFPSPETDATLASGKWPWYEWLEAAFRAMILRRPDDAERALRQMGGIATGTVMGRAFAEAVAEVKAERSGGPRATYAALLRIGFNGWVDVLKRRVDAEY